MSKTAMRSVFYSTLAQGSFVLLLFASAFWILPAFAQRALEFSIHQDYVSTRALGMGNAFIAVADDHSALFYNPAALALREDGHLRMFLRAGIDPDYFELADDIDKASGLEDEDEKIDAIRDVIVENYGEHYHARMPTLGAMWVRPNWGIAFLPADLTVDVGIHQQVGPMLNVNAYLDSTLAWGYARKVKWFGKKSVTSVGGTLKAIHRIHASEAISIGRLAADGEIFDTADANEGLTLDADLAIMHKPFINPTSFLRFLRHVQPTFAFVVRNVTDYGFPMNFHFIDEESGEPPKLERRFDLGSKWELPKFWVFDPHLAVDMRDMGHRNWTLKKGFHAGAEFYWTMFKWWKGHWAAGLNQGYWTAGLGLKLGWFQLDAASYGEEVGTSSVPKESRRYVLELALDF